MYTNEWDDIKNEKQQRLLKEAWEIVYEAIKCGYIDEASKRIQNITGVSESDSMDIIEHIKVDILKRDDSIRYDHQTNMTATISGKQTRDLSGLINCISCNVQISKKAEVCPHCGQPTGVHVCPKCQSSNTKTISGASKATSIFLWGPFAANKVLSKFQCNDCGHKW